MLIIERKCLEILTGSTIRTRTFLSVTARNRPKSGRLRECLKRTPPAALDQTEDRQKPPPDQLRQGRFFSIFAAISAAFRLLPEDITAIEAITDDSEQRVSFAGVLAAQLPKLLRDVVDVLLREQRTQIRRGQLRNVNRQFCHSMFFAMCSHFNNINPYSFVFVGVFPLSLLYYGIPYISIGNMYKDYTVNFVHCATVHRRRDML